MMPVPIIPSSATAATRYPRSFPLQDSDSSPSCSISFIASDTDADGNDNIRNMYAVIPSLLDRIRQAEQAAPESARRDMVLSNIDSLTRYIPKHRPGLQDRLTRFRDAMAHKMLDPSMFTADDREALHALHQAHSRTDEKLSKELYTVEPTTATLFSTLTATELEDIPGGTVIWQKLSAH